MEVTRDLLGHKIVAYRVVEPFKVWLRYDTGAEGIVNLDTFPNIPVFEKWKEPEFFEKLKIENGRRVFWDEQIDLCPDVLYMKLIGYDYARA